MNLIICGLHQIISSNKNMMAGALARMEEVNAYKSLVANAEGRDHLEGMGLDAAVIDTAKLALKIIVLSSSIIGD